MSATNAFETALLQHIFQNADVANVGDATGLRGSTTAGVFWVSLGVGSPGETGDQTTNETSYTNYGRVSVTRASGAGGWTVTGDTADNTSAVDFAQCGASGATLTDFGIGSNQTTAGNLFLYGALGASRVVSDGITPSFAAGALDITLD